MQQDVKTVLYEKKVIVFDWDGTLFDSMAGKTHSFSKVVSTYFAEHNRPINSDLVATIYRDHSGKPRAEIFIEAAKVAKLQLEQADIDEMSERLFTYNRTILIKSKLFPDAMRLLSALLESNSKLFISSSVPQAELDFFVKGALPEPLYSRFSGIMGSGKGFSKGREHLTDISSCSDAPCEDIIVIGDDEADYVLSNEAGVDCVLVNRDNQIDKCFSNLIRNLDELCNLQNLTVSTHS